MAKMKLHDETHCVYCEKPLPIKGFWKDYCNKQCAYKRLYLVHNNKGDKMQTELEQVITEFTIKMRDRYKTDSYTAGYFAAWVRQFGEADPKVARNIIRQLNYSMEICK